MGELASIPSSNFILQLILAAETALGFLCALDELEHHGEGGLVRQTTLRADQFDADGRESDEVRRPYRRRCVSMDAPRQFVEQRSPSCADRSRGPPELRGAIRPIWNGLKNERRCHVVESLKRVRRVSQLKSCGGDDFAPRLHG